MERLIQKILRYAGMILMAAFMITTLSCERDLFLMDEGSYNPTKVKLNIAFELPRQEEKAVTRSIVANDEYKLNDFYLMLIQNVCTNRFSIRQVSKDRFLITIPFLLKVVTGFLLSRNTAIMKSK